MGIFAECPRYGCFRYYYMCLFGWGYFRLFVLAFFARPAGLNATSRRLGPR